MITLLTVLNSLCIFICMYTLISKKYRTQSKDVTFIFLCLQVIFMCNLWAVIDGNIIQSFVFALKNFCNFALLGFCMYSVRRNAKKNPYKKTDISHYNFIDKVIYKFNNMIKRIVKDIL